MARRTLRSARSIARRALVLMKPNRSGDRRGGTTPSTPPEGVPLSSPTVTDISPANGPASGGTSVTITGTNFLAGSTVTINGTAATGVSITDDMHLDCTTPAGTAGVTGDVVVTNAAGSGTLTNGWTYNAAPTLTDVSPGFGPRTGGTSVVLTGSGFQNNSPGTNTVTFVGAGTANPVIVDSDTQITCGSPSGTPGDLVNVRVANNNGTVTLTNSFGYGPNADFSGTPLSGDAPLSVDFTDSSAGNVTTWDWDFGDEVTDTVQNPTHEYGGCGLFEVTLTAGGAYGSDPEVKTDYVQVDPVAGFTGIPLTGAVPLMVTFDASTTKGDPDVYTWDFGDGSPVVGGSIINHTYTSEGTYTVALTVDCPETGASDTQTRTNYITVTAAGTPNSLTPVIRTLIRRAGTLLQPVRDIFRTKWYH